MEPPASLCTLDLHPLHVIIHQLSLADRIRLSRTCKCMRWLCSETVTAVHLSVEDLDEWGADPLTAYPHASHVRLEGLELDKECAGFFIAAAPALLQQLRRLQIMSSRDVDDQALALLLQHCPSLTALQTYNSADDEWCQGARAPLPLHPRPQQLQALAFRLNNRMPREGLHAWLAVGSEGGGAEEGGGAHQVVGAHSGEQQVSWSHRLLQALNDGGPESSSSDSGGGGSCAGIDSSCVPAWPHLTSLQLPGCYSLGHSLAFLGWCPALRALSLHSCYKVNNGTFEALRQALDGSCNHQHNVGAADAGERGSADVLNPAMLPLQELDLSYTRISDAAMPHLVRAMPHLAWLGLKGCNVGDDGLVHVLQLQQLTALHIKHCHRVTDEGIISLAPLSQLCSLSYGYTSMPEADDVAAAIAAQFPRLTALDLLASELTDAGLAPLTRLVNLAQLKLYQAGITGHGLAAHLSHTGLSSLVLYGTGCLRELACLGVMPALQRLQLGSLCDLEGSLADAVRQLTVVRQLSSLTLERMEGVTVDALQHVMAHCRSLQHVRVRGCDGVSAEDAWDMAATAAATCSSSACVWLAHLPSCDTDDEEDGWQLVRP